MCYIGRGCQDGGKYRIAAADGHKLQSPDPCLADQDEAEGGGSRQDVIWNRSANMCIVGA